MTLEYQFRNWSQLELEAPQRFSNFRNCEIPPIEWPIMTDAQVVILNSTTSDLIEYRQGSHFPTHIQSRNVVTQ